MQLISSSLQKKLILIHNISKQDVYLLNLSGDVKFSDISSEQPWLIKQDINLIISKIVDNNKINSKQIAEMVSPLGFNYLVLFDFEESNYLLIGPILLASSNINISASGSNNDRIEMFLKYLQVLSDEQYINLQPLIYNMFHNDYLEFEIKKVENIKSEPINLIEEDEYYQDENFIKVLEKTHATMNSIDQCIQFGNINKLDNILAEMALNTKFITSKRLKVSYFRNLQDLAITTNSIFLRSALKGGVPVILGYQISNLFATRIERTMSLSELQNIHIEISKTYCQAVYDYSKKEYSGITKKAIDYILFNIENYITVNELAEKLFVNPSYLSRKFKEDTGITLTEYVIKEKIKQSKVLIQSKRYSLMEISMMTGFNSYTVFAKHFKRETGFTPRKYIDNLSIDLK